MAFTATLKRGGDSYSLSVSDDWEPPSLAADISIVGGSGTADPRLVREQIGTPATMIVPLVITDSSQPNLVAEVDTLNAFLRAGSGLYLEVTFQGSSTATIWPIIHAQPVTPRLDTTAQLTFYVFANLVLTVSPFAEKAEVSLYTSEAVTNPDSLSLSGMVGTFKSPLTIEWNATSADTHAFYVAIDATSFDAYRKGAAADITWGTGFEDYADADAFATNSTKFASTSYVAGPVATGTFPEGLYLLLARVKVNGAATGYMYTSLTDEEITWTRTSWHLIELGTVWLPTRKVRNSGTANLTFYVKSSSATAGQEACVDWVYALPLSSGAWWWHPTTETAQCDTIGRIAETGITYIDDVVDESYVTGANLMALGGKLLIVSQDTAGTDPTHNGAITVKYTPRYGWMR